ncbi:MAG: tRNA-intron lyase [Methanomicrobia archaeon]|nr:tRNA-intron lyase [Methanomicrobia archaeon]HDM22922.1 tRNA-intron lyase [Methanomicrobia archaeon]
MITGKLLENRVVIEDKKSIDKLRNKAYGTLEDNKLYLGLIEALYLIEKEKLELSEGMDILEAARKEREFDIKFLVYKDLRERGLIVKTGFKYGTHFRVYRGSLEEHAEYLVHVMDEKDKFKGYDLIRTARMANTVNKKMILAFVDMENDITYIELKRVKL